MKASKFYGIALALLLCGLSTEVFAQKNLEEVVRKCKSDKSVDKSVVTKKDPATKQKRRVVSSFEVESGSPLYQEVMTAFERDKEEAYQIIENESGGNKNYFIRFTRADGNVAYSLDVGESGLSLTVIERFGGEREEKENPDID